MNTFTYTNKKQKNRLYKNMSVTSLNHLDLKKKKQKQNLKNKRKFHSNHTNYFF